MKFFIFALVLGLLTLAVLFQSRSFPTKATTQSTVLSQSASNVPAGDLLDYMHEALPPDAPQIFGKTSARSSAVLESSAKTNEVR